MQLSNVTLLPQFKIYPPALCIKEFNLLASGFKWLQSTFAYDILFARDLNFSTWFTKNVNIPGTKQD